MLGKVKSFGLREAKDVDDVVVGERHKINRGRGFGLSL